MIFAILGLRTMYFALNATDHLFGYGIIISPTTSLYVVLGILLLGIIASVIWPNQTKK